MVTSINELREKEVIDVLTGKRIGYASDFLVDPSVGELTAIVLPGGGSVFTLGKREERVISWEDIVRIGEDAILVNVPCVPAEEEGNSCRGRRKDRKNL